MLIPAFAELIHRRGFQTVDWHLYSVDRIGRELARSAGLRVEEAMASGTVVVLNFPQAVRRLWPLLVERAPELAEVPISLLSHTPRQRGVWETSGVREAEEVSEAEEVWDAEGIGKATYVIRLGEEAYSLPDRGAVAHLLFGTREPSNLPPLPEGRLGELLRAALPVPALWYGVNYV
ncbi:MAG: hypothetical protein KatS3mg115_1393 [Candidatus Poribacteria bacterium]|nr:MAG: hypothetical protein KatS3mg115_1393 [Candidatus Poribacteria bacterium]